MLAAIYKEPATYILSANRLYASREKVENVVNPPHTPVFRKTSPAADRPRFAASPVTKPMRMAPRTFTMSVRIGNAVRAGIELMAYLPTPPRALPSATRT